ncbi:MAG: response regulator [Chloroflexi bacterium]|nr:response regulator [Chloroflexota bacterium]
MYDEHTFLYVEDDSLSREVMSMIFRAAMEIDTLTVFEDSHNFEARLRALPQRPSMILLDIHVPPIDGFGMLAIIKNMPELEGVPVIAVTASVMNEEFNQFKDEGFDGAIGKPVNVETFPPLIERIMNGEEVWHIS